MSEYPETIGKIMKDYMQSFEDCWVSKDISEDEKQGRFLAYLEGIMYANNKMRAKNVEQQ